ncbi:hypothetical protein [Streptomyces xylophagus]|uniref:hypothetical protein n=1 Tax=Streptomyces xylophagus TaxID=285514 RepID=UPI0005BCE6AA|nr:hypothetical protein [Streptomyces xylophagus]
MHQQVSRIFFGIDIAGFNRADRSDCVGLVMRRTIYDALQRGLDDAGIPPERYELLDRGDGVMTVLDPSVGIAGLVHTTIPTLTTALLEHNKLAHRAHRIQLRAALHCGQVVRDKHGYAGRDISHAFRLLDSPELRVALAKSDADLVLAISGSARLMMSPDYPSTQLALTPVRITTKESSAQAWFTEVTPNPALSR